MKSLMYMIVVALVFSLFLPLNFASAGQVYIWVDENGQSHIADYPSVRAETPTRRAPARSYTPYDRRRIEPERPQVIYQPASEPRAAADDDYKRRQKESDLRFYKDNLEQARKDYRYYEDRARNASGNQWLINHYEQKKRDIDRDVEEYRRKIRDLEREL